MKFVLQVKSEALRQEQLWGISRSSLIRIERPLYSQYYSIPLGPTVVFNAEKRTMVVGRHYNREKSGITKQNKKLWWWPDD